LRAALLPAVVWAGALGIFVHHLRAFWPFVLDDAFITFRYASNLASGHGPTWNPGAPPAEGYSSFLWMLAMSVPHALGLDPLRFARVLGTALTLGSFGVSFALASRLSGSDPGPTRWLVGSVAVLFQASFPPIAVHAAAGMDTALFTFLFQLLLYSATFLVPRPCVRGLVAVPLVGLLLGMTRPEGVLVAAAVLATSLVCLPRSQRARVAAWTGGLLVLPGALYFLWRATYYGHLFPLPFYLKVGSAPFLAGAGTVLGFLGFLALPLGPLFVPGLVRLRARALPQGVAALAFVAFYLFPAHVMGIEWRFLTPVFPFLAVVAACGIPLLLDGLERLAAAHGRARLGRRLAGVAIVLLLCPLVSWGLARGLSSSLRFTRNYADMLENVHVALGKELAPLREGPETPVLAINDAGAVPYFSGWRTIDVVGLNEPAIALSDRREPQLVLSHEPDLVVLLSLARGEMQPEKGWFHEIYAASLENELEVIRTVGAPPYHLLLLARPDGEIADALRVWDPPKLRRWRSVLPPRPRPR